MAMMAAMKNVLSPNSETMMTEKEATKAWMKPVFPLLEPSAVIIGPTGWGVEGFCEIHRSVNQYCPQSLSHESHESLHGKQSSRNCGHRQSHL